MDTKRHSQAYQTIPPLLSYLGSTPVAKELKRGCTELSHVAENPRCQPRSYHSKCHSRHHGSNATTT